MGSKDSKLLGTYRRDAFNDNGGTRLSFAAPHYLALVNTFFHTPKGGALRTFNGRGKNRIDYALTRQRDGKLVRNVTAHHLTLSLDLSISVHKLSTSSAILLATAVFEDGSRAATRPWASDDLSLASTGDGHGSRKAPLGKTRKETAVWTTWKPHCLRPVCRPLNW